MKRTKVITLRLHDAELATLVAAASSAELAVWIRESALAAANPARAKLVERQYTLALCVVYAGNQVRHLSDLLEDLGVIEPSLDVQLDAIAKALRVALSGPAIKVRS